MPRLREAAPARRAGEPRSPRHPAAEVPHRPLDGGARILPALPQGVLRHGDGSPAPLRGDEPGNRAERGGPLPAPHDGRHDIAPHRHEREHDHQGGRGSGGHPGAMRPQASQGISRGGHETCGRDGVAVQRSPRTVRIRFLRGGRRAVPVQEDKNRRKARWPQACSERGNRTASS